MRVALLGDMHGNLEALDAVLEAIHHQTPDRIVCLGDVATTGPYPHECVARIQEIGCPVVLGNWDDWMLAVREGRRSYDGCRPIDRWCAEQMTVDDLAAFRRYRPTVDVDLGAGLSLHCFHGSPRSYSELITSITPIAELDDMLGGRREGILAGGHTHVAMLRRHGQALIVNPGSVSENWDFSAFQGRAELPMAQRFNPWAEFAMVEQHQGQVSVAFQRVPVDVDRVIAGAVAREMPGAADWAAQWTRH